MIKEVTVVFTVLLLLFLFLGLALFLFSVFRKQAVVNYLSLSYILRAVGYIGPSIVIYNINIEFSVWLTGPIKVFIIPLNYLFVRKLFEADKSWGRRDYWHFLPFILDCLLTFPIAYYHANEVVNNNSLDFTRAFGTVWQGNFYFTLLSTVGRSVSFLQWVYYFLLSLPLVNQCITSLRSEKSQINHQYIVWLKGITIVFIGMGLVEGLAIFGVYRYPLIFICQFFFLIFYAFYFFLFVILFVGETNVSILDSDDDSVDVCVGNVQVDSWLCEFVKHQYFLDSNLTLQKLSEQLCIPKYKLKIYINDLGYSSFYSFINYYRVEKSKELLLTLPDSYVVESVFEDSGFSSRSTYFRVFKEFSGVTPAKYIRDNYN